MRPRAGRVQLELAVLGALVEVAILSFASPAALGGKRHSRWKVLGIAVLFAVVLVLVGLVGRRGRPLVTDAPSAMLALIGGLGMGLGIALRSLGRLPVLDEATIAVTTGVFWYAVVFFLPGHPILATLGALLGATLSLLVLRDALRRSPMTPEAKRRAYAWTVFAGVWLGAMSYLDPQGGILFAGYDGGGRLASFLVGMAVTYLVAQATLALVLILRERKKHVTEESLEAGYVRERDLLPRIVDDRQSAPLVLVGLAVGTAALLLANHAWTLVPEAAAVSAVLVLAPLVALARRGPGPAS